MAGDSGDGYFFQAKNGARAKIRQMIADINYHGFSTKQPFAIGRVEKRMSDFASQNNIDLASKSVYISSQSINHARRDSKKKKGLAPSDNELISFPTSRRLMDLYHDGEAFIYTNYQTKYIIHPNYELKINRKKIKKVNFVTAGVVTDANEFNLPKYTKIQ